MNARDALKQRIGRRVVTVDMDGTLEDSWACCGVRTQVGGTRACRHARRDTLARVDKALRLDRTAELVVLSWRQDLERVTREWVELVGLRPAAVFTPDSTDTAMLGAVDGGQVGFKVSAVQELAELGVTVTTGFDDNVDVCTELNQLGAPLEQVERVVRISHEEFLAGTAL